MALENEEEWRRVIRKIIRKNASEIHGADAWEQLEWDSEPTPEWPESEEDMDALVDMCCDEAGAAKVTVTWGE